MYCIKSKSTYARGPYTWKETYIHGKRPMYMKRDMCWIKSRETYAKGLYTWKETYNSNLYTWQETHCGTSSRSHCIHSKSTHARGPYTWKETYKRDLYTWKEICTASSPNQLTQEAHIHGKRPIYMERDLCTWKETCAGSSPGWLTQKAYIRGKRLIIATYTHDKRLTAARVRAVTVSIPNKLTQEAHIHGRRPKYMKRDLYTWKETCGALSAKRLTQEGYMHWKRLIIATVHMKRD